MGSEGWAFLLTWALFAAIGTALTGGNPDRLENRWLKVFGIPFILCVIRGTKGLFD
jgi:hypothetical protein